MRPIDADALRAAMYHEAFEMDSNMQKWDSGCWIRYKMFENHIKAAPTIDAVPIVRCKDCKQCRKTILFGHFATVCDYWIKLTDDDGYCNHAERKES